VLVLELALVLVILLIVREVMRLRREIGHSRMALPRIDEIQRLDVASAAPTNPGEPGYRSSQDAASAAGQQSNQVDNVEMLADRLDKLRDEVERLAGADGQEVRTETRIEEASAAPIVPGEPGHRSNESAESADREPEPEAVPVAEEPVVLSKPAPRVLSEAGRATYDRALHLAAGGLDVESIAREVDLTIAEVEVMLGSAPKASGRHLGRNS